jgi:hypothetical protein
VVAGDPYAEEAIYQVFLSRLADLSEETALCFGRTLDLGTLEY